jgi:mRNA-degrading endonuclease RelE of RelBE toxin-antitoxin system/DNA-binding Xre family transcriptional regulator
VKQVTYTKAARKVLFSLPRPTQQRIRDKVEQYAADPSSLANNVKALKGSKYFRLRVGDWRVIMDDQGLVVEVVEVGPRGSIMASAAQKITTPGGEELMVIPLAEYEALLDAADIASADRIKARVAAGLDAVVPAELVNRIIDGENSIRVWREYRKLSAADLAAKAGISAAYISELESGKKTGGVATLRKIANALDLDLDDLVP